MRVAFLGTGDFAVPALEALVRARHDVIVAISQPDRAAGRGRKVRPTAVRSAADGLGVVHVQTEDVNTEDVRRACGDAEIGVVAAFGQKIGKALLEGLPRGCVNIHGSLLPKYRGAAPYQWAIINGEAETGVTVFQLDERWDAGAIWARRATPIIETETADELHDRLAVLGAELIVDALALIDEGRVEPQVQDASRSTRAPKLSKADGAVDWTQPAFNVVRRIHGLWSWPSASCTFSSRMGKSERVQLARAEVVETETRPAQGFPAGAFRTDGTIQAGNGRVRLLEVKPQGGKLMPFAAFANGRHVQPPDRLLPLESS